MRTRRLPMRLIASLVLALAILTSPARGQEEAAALAEGRATFDALAARCAALDRVSYTAKASMRFRIHMGDKEMDRTDRVTIEVDFDRARGVRRTYRFEDGTEAVVALDADEARRRALEGVRDPELDAHPLAKDARAALDPLHELLLGASRRGRALSERAWTPRASGIGTDVRPPLDLPSDEAIMRTARLELHLDAAGRLEGATLTAGSERAEGGMLLRFETTYVEKVVREDPFPAGTFPEPTTATASPAPRPVGAPWDALRAAYAKVPRATYRIVRRTSMVPDSEESWTVSFERGRGLRVEGAFGMKGGLLIGDGQRLWMSEGRVADPARRTFQDVRGGMKGLADEMFQDLVLLSLTGDSLGRCAFTLHLLTLTWTEGAEGPVGVTGRGFSRIEVRLVLDAEGRLARWRLDSGEGENLSTDHYEVRDFAVPETLPAALFAPPPERAKK